MAKNSRTEKDSGGVIAVSRAFDILDAIQANEKAVPLGELSRRTGLHKTTVLRIARTMAAARYLVQLENGSWRLGPGSGWLGARYQTTFDQTASIEPLLRELSLATGESAAFYIREGESRICVVRAEGPQAIRHHVRVGEALPLNKGSIGRVLLAFSDEPGKLYERIRRAGYHLTVGERDPQVASISCPVFGMNRVLVGCVAITGPIARFGRAVCKRHSIAVRKAAGQLSYELSNIASGAMRI